MYRIIKKQVKDLLQIMMKIPLFKDGERLNSLFSETTEIELTHPDAVEMACENVAWQVDDTYFDASFEVWVNGELFFENGTTDAHGTWRDFVNALSKRGKHSICFLDSPIDLHLMHQEHYTFQYIHTNYVWGDDNYLISRSEKTITSMPLPTEVVESEIKGSFRQFATFMLQNDIPISKAYKEELTELLAEV